MTTTPRPTRSVHHVVERGGRKLIPVHAVPVPYPEAGYAEGPLSGPEPDPLVEEIGDHEPLLSFPSGFEEDRDWAGAFDALVAAELFRT
jgi:hypothetical protein